MTVTAGRAIQMINSDEIVAHLALSWAQCGQLGGQENGLRRVIAEDEAVFKRHGEIAVATSG